MDIYLFLIKSALAFHTIQATVHPQFCHNLLILMPYWSHINFCSLDVECEVFPEWCEEFDEYPGFTY